MYTDLNNLNNWQRVGSVFKTLPEGTMKKTTIMALMRQTPSQGIAGAPRN